MKGQVFEVHPRVQIVPSQGQGGGPQMRRRVSTEWEVRVSRGYEVRSVHHFPRSLTTVHQTRQKVEYIRRVVGTCHL